MNNKKTENPYLGKILDAYHLSVKRWGRDLLIAVFVIVTAWIFIVLPYLRWSEEKPQFSKALESKKEELDDIGPFLNEVLAIEKEFDKEKESIAKDVNALSAHLVWRVRGFVDSVKKARAGKGISLEFWKPDSEFRESFPRSFTNQFTIQSDTPPGPNEILEKVYSLTKENISIITSPKESHEEIPESKEVSEIAREVFQNEIKCVYQKLNSRVKTGFANLQICVRGKLKDLASNAKKFKVNLPDTNDIIVSFNTIDQPKMELFNTVEGKRKTLEEETNKIKNHIKTAQAPVEKARKALVTSVDALKNSVKNLETKRSELQNKIQKLQGNIGKATEQFDTPFPLPLKWFPPLKIESFVRGYPIFVSIIYLIFALRYARLSKLRKLLLQQFKQQDMSKENIDFALYIPGSPSDWLSGLGFISPGMLKATQFIIPFLVLALVLGAIWQIETNPPFDKDFATLQHVCSIGFCILGCFYFLHSLFRK